MNTVRLARPHGLIFSYHITLSSLLQPKICHHMNLSLDPNIFVWQALATTNSYSIAGHSAQYKPTLRKHQALMAVRITCSAIKRGV